MDRRTAPLALTYLTQPLKFVPCPLPLLWPNFVAGGMMF